jgi:hypothetical protein
MDVQFILDPYVAMSYCTSYLTNIDKTITKELKAISIDCNENKIEATLAFKKWGTQLSMFNKC